MDASNTAKVETIATLSALESSKALETCEAAKLLHLLLLGLLLLLKTKHGRETVLLRLLGLLLHALKSSNAIHLHTLESSELLLKATHTAALKQHRELLLLKLLLKHGLLLPLGLGHEGKLKLILLLLLWIGRSHIVEAVGAGITP